MSISSDQNPKTVINILTFVEFLYDFFTEKQFCLTSDPNF